MADSRGATALAILLVDMPGVPPSALRHVIATWRPGRIAVAEYAGKRAQPIVMDLALRREAAATARADEGARAFLDDRPDLIDAVALTETHATSTRAKSSRIGNPAICKSTST